MDELEMTTTTEDSTVVDAGDEVDASVDTTEPSSEESAEVAEPQEQEPATPEVDVNAIAAAARRKAEAQLHSIDEEYKRRFGHLTNPITGKPISSQRDYLEALDAQEQMRAKEQLEQNGIDPSLIDNLIANNPAVRQAQLVMEQAQQAQMQNQIASDLAELNKLDPSITTIDTVPPNVIQMVYDNREKGLTLVDCYKILNFGKVSSNQQAAITQQVINQAKGKAHLNPVNGVATPEEGVEIPPSELELWKDMFPDKSAADLKKLYNRTLK